MISEFCAKLILLLVLACTLIFAAGIAGASPGEDNNGRNKNTTSPDSPVVPFITIDPIGNHTVGEVFFINGTTNLPVSESLFIEVFLTEYPSQQKTYSSFSGIPITSVPIKAGANGCNTWSVNVTVGNWMPKEYVAEVISPNNPSVIPQYQVFMMFLADPIPTVLQMPNQDYTSSVQPNPSVVTGSQTRQFAPLSLMLPILVLAVMGIMRSILKELLIK